MRIMRRILALTLLVLLVACEPSAAAAEPRGWLRFSNVPALDSPEFSIAAPPGWHGEPTDDHETELHLEGPKRESIGLSVRRFSRIKAVGDEWLAEVGPRSGIDPAQVDAEWLDLPGGRARHVQGTAFDTYLFRASEDDAVLVLTFIDFDFAQDAEDLARNLAMAETFRIEAND
jgi:hypothetical protein